MPGFAGALRGVKVVDLNRVLSGWPLIQAAGMKAE